jgi:hypothetical protein
VMLCVTRAVDIVPGQASCALMVEMHEKYDNLLPAPGTATATADCAFQHQQTGPRGRPCKTGIPGPDLDGG